MSIQAEKKEIILNEIDRWRNGRLLPEQYCDFLENLYKDETEPSRKRFLSVTSIRQGNPWIWFLGFGIFACIFFIGFYFSRFPWPLQMASALLLTCLLYTVATLARPGSKWNAYLAALTGSLMLLGFGDWMLRLQDWEDPLSKAVLIGICAVVWAAAGFFLRLPFLHYCGLACGLLLYAFLFSYWHPHVSWAILQLLWLPLCVVFGWLSWLTHFKRLDVSGVYFAVAATIWLMPEADAYLLRHEAPEFLVGFGLAKLALAFIILFMFRKKWITWVAS
ncbi:hypothetical protein AWM70_11490 [Paenibacillus yonginensis]|uniref:DUF2157 domain-containing protein n=1 Tax=Paenibacillus yonginensis TaxID=1462996 RepID=A0A1B1N133_9BACL|nr:hypothetical protein [Paenibacillus yonginensis]ANS75147.1 hypothetical protein AWM70_11490 [Paenibacillus yonginensis]